MKETTSETLMMVRSAGLGLALCVGLDVFGAARLVLDGVIGQSGTGGRPVPWTGCCMAAADRDGNIHFSDGLVLLKGRQELTRSNQSYSGQLLTDGNGEFFSFVADGRRVGVVAADAAGLRQGAELGCIDTWQAVLHVAPATCRTGFAANARFFALDTSLRQVRAWASDLTPLGVVFDYTDLPHSFCSIAVQPSSGDLLLGVGWPDNLVHRFRPDGSEVTNSTWPFAAIPNVLQNAGDDTWALGDQAVRLPTDDSANVRLSIGVCSKQVQGIACSAGGYWLATTQGAQYYSASDPDRCARRVGGVGQIDTLAILDGRVVVSTGRWLLNFWLDDVAGDILECDQNWGWTLSDDWYASASGLVAGDGRFYVRLNGQSVVRAFDPTVTSSTFRDQRYYEVPDAQVEFAAARAAIGDGYVAVAGSQGVELYRTADGGGLEFVCRTSDVASLIAAEGNWLVAYVPARQAICRYRLEGGDDVVFPNADGTGNLLSVDAWGGEVQSGRPIITEAGDYFYPWDTTSSGLRIESPFGETVRVVATNEAGPVDVTMYGKIQMYNDINRSDAHRRRLELVGGNYNFQDNADYGWEVGSWDWGCRTEYVDLVLDGAVFANLHSLTMTHSTSGNIHWLLKGRAVVEVLGGYKVSTGNGAENVVVDVMDGSRFSIGSDLVMSGGSGNGFRISDPGSHLDVCGGYCWVGTGEDCSIVVSNGASANIGVAWGLLLGGVPSAHGCSIVATGSNSVFTAGLTYLGYCGDCTVSNQTIQALDGATVALGVVQLSGGHDNGFVVSNATLTCGNMPYRWQSDHDEWQWWSTNYFIRIQGDTPKFSSTGALHLRQNFKFIFDLPAGQYKTGEEPLVNFDAWCCVQHNDQSSDVIINGLESFAKNMQQRGESRRRVRLIRYGAGISYLAQEAIDRWNSYLQGVEGVKSARLFFEGDSLWLEVRVDHGLLMILR